MSHSHQCLAAAATTGQLGRRVRRQCHRHRQPRCGLHRRRDRGALESAQHRVVTLSVRVFHDGAICVSSIRHAHLSAPECAVAEHTHTMTGAPMRDPWRHNRQSSLALVQAMNFQGNSAEPPPAPRPAQQVLRKFRSNSHIIPTYSCAALPSHGAARFGNPAVTPSNRGPPVTATSSSSPLWWPATEHGGNI